MSPDVDRLIGRNVAAERTRRGWRQDDLAEALGWQRSTISHLEHGRRKVLAADLEPLCRALGVRLIVLLAGAGSETFEALGL
jgi:transcriptional regulator with XRE-family HTH domain